MNPHRLLLSAWTVTAKMTSDVSDWGDVIKAAGAEYDFGIDAKAEFAYTTRRLVDGAGSQPTNHPDIVLINNPNVDSISP